MRCKSSWCLCSVTFFCVMVWDRLRHVPKHSSTVFSRCVLHENRTHFAMQQRTCKTQTYSYMGGPICVVFLYFSMKLTLSINYHSNVSLLLLHCTPNSWVLWNGNLSVELEMATPSVTTTNFMNKYLKFNESGKNPYLTTFLLVEWELHQTLQLCFYSLPFSLSLRITT